jgi:hypothetical protein
MRAKPGAYPQTARPPEGGNWQAGGREWRINPRYALPEAYFHVVGLWNRCQGGMGGYAQLPEPGGMNAQPAWLINAFGVLSAAEAEARPDP